MGQALKIFPMPALANAVLALLLAGLLAGCATSPAQVSRWADAGGYDSIRRLQPLLSSSDPALRQSAIAGLLKLAASKDEHDMQDAVKVLSAATVSPDPSVRGEVGAALLFNPEENLDFYSITLAADPDPAVRKKIAQGLAAAGRAGPLRITQRASIYLWGLTQDNDADVRAAAIEGAASLGLDDPIGFALDALRRDPDPRVRAAACRGLGLLAHAYLSGERGPDWHDAQVEQFLAQIGPGANRTPTQARGEEIIAALINAANSDDGTYDDVSFERHVFYTERVEETHYVASAAAAALTVPGLTPRPDIAAAIAAAQARVPAIPPPPVHHLPLFRFTGKP